jgi:hypothetical protein
MIDQIKQMLLDRGIEGFLQNNVEWDEEAYKVLEVWHNSRKLTIYQNIDGTAEIIRVWGPNIHSDMGDYTISDPIDAISHIDWLDGG